MVVFCSSVGMDIGLVKRLLRYSKGSDPYLAGVEKFLEFAFKDKPEGIKIYCPCQTCAHTTVQTRDDMYGHLVCNGILENYDEWNFQGNVSVQHTSSPEPNSNIDERYVNVDQLIQDAVGHLYDDTPMTDGQESVQGPNIEAQQFYK